MAAPAENPGLKPLVNLPDVAAYPLEASGNGIDAVPAIFLRAGVLLGAGWSGPEGSWVWSDGPAAALTINTTGLSAHLMLTLKGMVYSDGKTPQTVTLLGPDGSELARASALDGDIVLSAPVTAPQTGPLPVRLRIARPVSPASLGRGGDTRLLGFGIKEVQLKSAP